MKNPCVWCAAGRKTYAGCCGRSNPHHHTEIVSGKWGPVDLIRIIPSDDCRADQEAETKEAAYA